jgi:tryptophan halogenase
VGIVGGGTAGWLTALALRARAPGVEVTVIESTSIPIIGVGEASVPTLVSFLHRYLGLDVHEFTREVKPTSGVASHPNTPPTHTTEFGAE